MAPVLCMVTDRRRHGERWEETLVRRVAAAARAGVALVQVREPDLDDRDLLRLVERCVDVAAGTRCRILVNDRADVALAARGDGVHLRGDSPLASRIRTLVGPGVLLGRSVHSAADAQVAYADRAVDYLIFGTVFESTSKPGVAPAGLAGLKAAVAATPLPVLAIGGVTVERFDALAHTGACGAAGIGLFADGDDEALATRVAQVRRVFDSVRTGS